MLTLTHKGTEVTIRFEGFESDDDSLRVMDCESKEIAVAVAARVRNLSEDKTRVKTRGNRVFVVGKKADAKRIPASEGKGRKALSDAEKKELLAAAGI